MILDFLRKPPGSGQPFGVDAACVDATKDNDDAKAVLIKLIIVKAEELMEEHMIALMEAKSCDDQREAPAELVIAKKALDDVSPDELGEVLATLSETQLEKLSTAMKNVPAARASARSSTEQEGQHLSKIKEAEDLKLMEMKQAEEFKLKYPGRPYQDMKDTRFAEVLRQERLAVVKQSYFEKCLSNGTPFQDRASIPADAFISGNDVMVQWEEYGAAFLVIFSYSWISPGDHFFIPRRVTRITVPPPPSPP